MFKSFLVKSTVLALTLGSFTASANEVIDLFSDNQAFIQVVGASSGSSVVGVDMIGGERDIQVTAGSDVRASAEVRNGQLLIGSNGLGGGTPGEDAFNVTVQWDGLDGSSALNTDGLGGVNFSELFGFSAEILSSDGPGTFDVTIYDTSNVQSATLTLPFIAVAIGSPETFTIPFNVFNAINPLLNLASIGSIQLSLDAEGDTDIRVASIRAVPEPSGLALMGLTLLGLVGVSRKKNRA